MALVVNTNIASLAAQNYATASRKDMETAMERLSSGQRINSAADDAAGLAISTRLEAQIRGLSKGIQNANDAISMAQTAEGAQKEITEMLQRIRELAVQASNSSNNADDRAALDSEVSQLIAEIDQIATTTEFNGQQLLDGGFSANIQMGPSASNQMEFAVDSMRATDLGLGAGSAASGTSFVTGRTALAAIEAGDVLINGQSFGAIAAAADLGDVAAIINEGVDNVEASAFNEVVMKHVGTGVSTNTTDVILKVTLLNATRTTSGSELTFNVGDSDSMAELVSNINSLAGAYVTASVDSNGKLLISNNTGATIKLTDATTGQLATGIGSSGEQTYKGFLKLESTDGSDIRIEKGFTSSNIGTDADLLALGLREVGSDNDPEQANQIQGAALTDATFDTAFAAGDIKINGVDVYDSAITTTSIDGKLEAINAKSVETGVVATAKFEQVFDISAAVGADASDGTTGLVINGTQITGLSATASASDYVTQINLKTEFTGITASAAGNNVKLTGSVSTVTIADDTTAAGFTADTYYAGIRLDSLNDSAIAIDLGEGVYADATKLGFGLLEANVGAADFNTNDPTGFSGGNSLTGVTVSTISNAQAAITAIDRALQAVSDSSSSLGAVQNRLSHAIANMQETVVNTEASRSRIVDADFAVESANLAKQQVLQQAATAMLAQANASTQSVLTLLGG